MKRPRLLAFLLVVGFASLAVACLGQVGARGWTGPVRLGEITIVSTRDGRLDGLSADGQRIWRFPNEWVITERSAEDLDGVYGTPLIGNYNGEDVVFVGDYNGYVYAFRPGEADVINPPAAFFELGSSVIGGLALDTANDALYVTSGRRVFALRASDLVDRIDRNERGVGAVGPAAPGENLGVLFAADDDIWGEPVLVDGRLLVDSIDGNLYAIDPATGAEIWRFESGDALASTPVVVGDLVLVAGFGSKLFGVNLADGSERWSFTTGHWIWGKPAVDGDIAYIADFDGVVQAVDLNTGEGIWSLEPDYGPIRASPALSSGTLLVSSEDGWLAGIDLATRSVAWNVNIDTKLNADMTVSQGEVLIAPQGCVTPIGGGDQKVYYTKVDPRNGDLSIASGVC